MCENIFRVTWGNGCQISGPSTGPVPGILTEGRLWSSGTTGRSEPQTPSHHYWGSYLGSSAEEKRAGYSVGFVCRKTIKSNSMRTLLNTVGYLLIQIFVINPRPLFFILSSLLKLTCSPSLNTIQYSFRNNIQMEYLYTEAFYMSNFLKIRFWP